MTHELNPSRHGWIHVAEGGVEVNGTPLAAGDGGAVSNESKLEVAGKSKAQVLVFALN